MSRPRKESNHAPDSPSNSSVQSSLTHHWQPNKMCKHRRRKSTMHQEVMAVMQTSVQGSLTTEKSHSPRWFASSRRPGGRDTTPTSAVRNTSSTCPNGETHVEPMDTAGLAPLPRNSTEELDQPRPEGNPERRDSLHGVAAPHHAGWVRRLTLCLSLAAKWNTSAAGARFTFEPFPAPKAG